MNKWAVIRTGRKQYLATEGQTIVVEKIKSKIDGNIIFDDILALSSDGQIKLGKPTVEKAKVKAKILEAFKEKKIRVVKFKSKSRYRRTAGPRQQKTKVLIENIES